MSTALYRRYRPDNFADLIGQEHVTEPLMAALTKNRVNHAYLFSGPRGCGKTTSARILARCLNCHQGPTPTPCGTCPSCVDLATGGQGSLDVVEIDAASHGGVDDARDLRERATFAPARDRYKIFIIDEAHMVTSQGFNALLKIVEEPPPHLKFIFATTEPDKVIGTIRSRTHHYPFRLVPPETLHQYLEELTNQEGMQAESGVLSLVIRAGGGSVRDTLSVLDQLIAGSADESLSYDRAVNLLGFTHAALLDDVVDALAARDAATLFRMVDHVVQVGQDPRRFVEDLLERFRDLIIIRAVPDNPGQVLRGIPQDVLSRMEVQAHNLGPAQLSLAADITNDALSAMVGATSPRLQLELLMARLMLPAAEVTQQSLAARLDRVEAHLAGSSAAEFTPVTDGSSPAPAATGHEPAAPSGDAPRNAAEVRAMLAKKKQDSEPSEPAQAPERTVPAVHLSEPTEKPQTGPISAPEHAPTPPAAQEQPTAPAAALGAALGAEEPVVAAAPEQDRPQETSSPATTSEPVAAPRPPATAPQPASPDEQFRESPPAEPQSAEPIQQAPAAPVPTSNLVEKARRLWPEIIQDMAQRSRILWMVAKDHTSVAGFDGTHLVVNFANDGARNTFASRGGEQALIELASQHLGVQCTVDLISGGGDIPGPKAPSAPDQRRPLPSNKSDHAAPASPAAQQPSGLGPEPDWSKPEPPVSWDPEPAADKPVPENSTSAAPEGDEPRTQGAPADLGTSPGETNTEPAATTTNPGSIPVPSFARKTETATPSSTAEPVTDTANVPPVQQPDPTQKPAPQTSTAAEQEPGYPADPYADVPYPDDPYPADADYSDPYGVQAAAQPQADMSAPVVPKFVRGDDTGTAEPAAESTVSTAYAEPKPISRWQQMMAAQQAQERTSEPEPQPEPPTYVEDIPSDEDEEIEASATFGRAALEKVLGARLIEERRPGQDPMAR